MDWARRDAAHRGKQGSIFLSEPGQLAARLDRVQRERHHPARGAGEPSPQSRGDALQRSQVHRLP